MKMYLLLGLSIFLVGIAVTVYEVKKLVEIDATTRNIKRPKLWSFVSLAGNRGEGLLTYFIYRNRHQVVNKTREQAIEMNRRKRVSALSISFMAIGAILIVFYITKI